MNSDAVDWLLEHAPREHWVEYYFPGNRYGHSTSNIAESLNAWLFNAREKSKLRFRMSLVMHRDDRIPLRILVDLVGVRDRHQGRGHMVNQTITIQSRCMS